RMIDALKGTPFTFRVSLTTFGFGVDCTKCLRSGKHSPQSSLTKKGRPVDCHHLVFAHRWYRSALKLIEDHLLVAR
ncbi:MAG: hypothetical protein ACRC9N_00215, partial [Aeromonas sp.]